VMVEPIIDSDEVNKALRIIRSIQEVPNPAYKKAQRDRKAFSPQPGSIRTTNDIPAANLSEVIQQREKRHGIKLLAVIKDICDYCPDCSDCSYAFESKSADMCERVKRNLIYMGVIE
jgi:hypothetical protein